MTQQSVEILIGKLLTDEELREAFEQNPHEVLVWLLRQGLQLSRLEIEFTSMGSLVDEVAPASFGCGVCWTRNVWRPCRLASGLSAVRTLIAEAQPPSASSVAPVSNCLVRIVFSCGGVKSWSPAALCTRRARYWARARGSRSHCGIAVLVRGDEGRRGGGGVVGW